MMSLTQTGCSWVWHRCWSLPAKILHLCLPGQQTKRNGQKQVFFCGWLICLAGLTRSNSVSEGRRGRNIFSGLFWGMWVGMNDAGIRQLHWQSADCRVVTHTSGGCWENWKLPSASTFFKLTDCHLLFPSAGVPQGRAQCHREGSGSGTPSACCRLDPSVHHPPLNLTDAAWFSSWELHWEHLLHGGTTNLQAAKSHNNVLCGSRATIHRFID